MNLQIKQGLRLILVISIFQLFHSCQDPLYDLSKDIDTEIAVGGDFLTIPIGSTDTIRLSSFLSSDDLSFLEVMEDGGYGLKIADSLYVSDLLKDLDKSKLKFEDYLFTENTSISFGDISLEAFKINGFSKRDSMDLNIPEMEIGDIAPTVAIAQQFSVGLSDFALTSEMENIADLNNNVSNSDIFVNVYPLNEVTEPTVHPEGDFSTPEPLVLMDQQGNPLQVKVNYSIKVPDGVKNIYEIELEPGASLEITMEVKGAADALKQGKFTPNISIDPTNLFKFSPFPVRPNDKITFQEEDALTNFNSYKKVKSYPITSLHNLPLAINNAIDIEKLITVTGKLAFSGTIAANKAYDLKFVDLEINVVVKGVKVKNMDFDIPTFKTSLNGESTIKIEESGLPSQVKSINKIYFGKTAGSTQATNLKLQFTPSNMQTLTSLDYKIEKLNITFPDGFVVSGLAGQTYPATFSPTTGFTVDLNLSEIDLSTTPINNGVLYWEGAIKYNGELSVNGRINSSALDNVNPIVNLTSQSAIKLLSSTVTTNVINEQIDPNELNIDLNVDIAEQVARLNTINIKDGATIRVNIKQPTLPLPIKANNLAIEFSEMFEFLPQTGLSNNKFTIDGNIPEFIELKLKALHINKDLTNGKLAISEKIKISGGIRLESGVVNSDEIANISGKKLFTEAIVSDLLIASTSVDMKTLEASYNDSTSINMQINDIPEQIASLDSIILKSGSSIALDINLANLPNLGSSPLNASIKISFPKLLVFAPGQVNANNEMIIQEPIVNQKLSKTILLRGLKFDGKALGGKLVIDEKINFNVAVRVENPTLNSEDLDNDPINVGVKVTLKGLEFQKVYGKFNVELDEDLNIDNIAFDLPDMLKGDDVMLDIANPVLTLSTESNIGIPVNAQLNLTKYRGGSLQTNDKLSVNFTLPKANTAAEIVKTNYWVSPTQDGKPAEYTYLATDLQNLFKPLPDSVKVEIKPTIDNSVQHLIDLQAMYSLKVKYGINVPFKFGKDLSITIKDTIDNVDLGLDENDVKSGKIELLGKILNSIPLNLELQMLFTDANFNILATTEKQSILAGAPDGKGVSSDITVTLADNLDDLKRLNKVILTFKATSNATIAGTPIKPDNYIRAELKARIGGVKVTL